MPRVLDRLLHRQLDHTHVAQTNLLYLLKAGDTATGTIVFPVTDPQGCALIASINASTTCQIQAVRVSIVDVGGYYGSTDVEGALQEIGATALAEGSWRRYMLVMGA